MVTFVDPLVLLAMPWSLRRVDGDPARVTLLCRGVPLGNFTRVELEKLRDVCALALEHDLVVDT